MRADFQENFATERRQLTNTGRKGHRLPAAAVVAAVLAASSADLTRRAASADPKLGAALAPYPAWTSFATVMSADIARLNR